MNSVIIFDVSNNQGPVIIQEMRTLGYYTSWLSGDAPNKTTVLLPHNTIWKPNTESQQGIDDLNQAIASVNKRNTSNILLTRCVVLNSTPWRAIPGN
jgi:GH18 family chitinase